MAASRAAGRIRPSSHRRRRAPGPGGSSAERAPLASPEAGRSRRLGARRRAPAADAHQHGSPQHELVRVPGLGGHGPEGFGIAPSPSSAPSRARSQAVRANASASGRGAGLRHGRERRSAVRPRRAPRENARTAPPPLPRSAPGAAGAASRAGGNGRRGSTTLRVSRPRSARRPPAPAWRACRSPRGDARSASSGGPRPGPSPGPAGRAAARRRRNG